ncbi:MAG TPA: hypothetical protein VNZ61_08815 [Roseomonas sp.]|nr:hypothetical protein [Roseomonas sp.]
MQGFWLRLASLMLASPTPGRWSFLGSVSASVSRLVSVSEPISETEAETHLETLAAIGMIELDRAANAILLPGVAADTARAEAARINGKRGGRPLKGETPEQALARRQGNLALPIAGGRAETQETARKPSGESSRAVGTTTPLKEESRSTAREKPTWVSLGEEIAELAGLDPLHGGFDFRPVQGWLSEGHSRETILQGVRDAMSRPTFDARRVRWLGFFSGAISDVALKRNRAAQGRNDQLAELEADRRRAEAIYGRAIA